MILDYYRIFYYVAQYKSFSKAADVMGNNQPNITRCMNILENELGCKLFIRSNRGVQLTIEGERLFEHVSIAIEQLVSGENELLKDKGLESGLVNIGASEIALRLFLLNELEVFHHRYPHVKLRISNHSTPQAVQALENGLRVYNGKPIVNSTNGEPEKLAAILPLCKKYGAAIVGLAIDEKGIQPKAADRVAIARRITEAALAAGIPREDIYIDCLTLTASAQQEDVLATVQALEACKKELGVRTVLGVSNISFGLPCRTYLNTTFLTMAMYAGLDLAIMNPSSEEMMAAVYAYNVLTNRDRQSTKYIARFADRVPASTALAQAAKAAPAASAAETELTGPYAALMKAVEKGLKGDAAAHTRALLAEKQPLEVVDEALIPALDIVGAKYEKGTLFLPQLLQAASAAQSAFEEIKTAIAQKGEGSASKGRIVLATVKGDVHDIGKNIVRVILENYGFEVLDLGRDVPVETVVDTVREKDVHLVGLSALMTTTLKSMEETIAALHAAKLDCKIMVGGAVLTPEYAEKIGADWYAKDAKRSADIAKEFFGV